MVDCTDARQQVHSVLRASLPDGRVMSDLRALLADAKGVVELDGQEVRIAAGATLQTIARSAHSYELPMGFGDHLRVLVAVGGVARVEHGVPVAEICFATMWYTADGRLTTVDFSRGMP